MNIRGWEWLIILIIILLLFGPGRLGKVAGELGRSIREFRSGLKERGGERYLPIVIGPAEANAISVVLEGIEMPRPLTPDLLRSIIDRIGVSVDSIVITDIQNNTFYANIILNANWTKIEIDARPSDAIAVALRVRAPIYVEESVLDKLGIQPEHDEPITM